MSGSVKPVVRIKEWRIDNHFLYGDKVLYGIPENHPDPFGGLVSNTKMITTSQVVKVDLEKREVETRNTLYQLIGPMASQEHIDERLEESMNRVNRSRAAHINH